MQEGKAEGVEARLAASGYTLPEVPEPGGLYTPAVRTGSLVFTAGQTPRTDGNLLYVGKVGEGITIKEAGDAARLCVLNALAAVRSEVGSLDKVARVVKLTGYVASAEGFGDQSKVVDGASEVIHWLLGPDGLHARTAVGVAELPSGAPVEVELVVEVYEGSEGSAEGAKR